MLKEDRHDVVFPGWDSGDPGTPEHRSIWLYGIEPGGTDEICEFINAPISEPSSPDEENYSVKYQWDIRRWQFNKKAHFLLSVIEGLPVTSALMEDTRRYADTHKIFERDCIGYFKGNLFPQKNISVGHWSPEAKARTGFDTKEEFYDFFRNYFDNLHNIILKHSPRLFIGTGLSHANDFSKVVCGEAVDFEEHTFTVNGYCKRLLLKDGETPLAVIPHLTGGRHGLNSYDSIIQAGTIIRERFRL
ncbi:hypothetical protein [Gluconacetobacter tumulisoli]|uniref:Uracil-DNA glycosylase-like domain-containing protein n=1 Tax=Gluconacetobacter tumulisoli TaxID=1286189 RepID=A0A7W4K5H8_9PROT|nr:hypothetical protein [Gluconacetobacter tumulisoli]MBB2200746.1 hypothetical protein [Gluconacetobacter tumulisoli]